MELIVINFMTFKKILKIAVVENIIGLKCRQVPKLIKSKKLNIKIFHFYICWQYGSSATKSGWDTHHMNNNGEAMVEMIYADHVIIFSV